MLSYGKKGGVSNSEVLMSISAKGFTALGPIIYKLIILLLRDKKCFHKDIW